MAPDSRSADDFYLPDFCESRAVFVVVLIVALVALTLSLAHETRAAGLWLDLGATSLYLLWVGLLSAACWCWARPRLARLPLGRASVIALIIPMAVTAIVCEVALRVGQPAGQGTGILSLFPRQRAPFLTRSVCLAFIVTALALRYFYVAHQWRRNVQMEARARVDALQARIRPHFLFNSMNTIAALTRSNPRLAEEAVQDLADLFRVSLSEQRPLITLKEELEVARIYQRIEQLRLGDRLRVTWHVEELPMRSLVPSLLVQPLLENAIYHGIESLPEGGTVDVEGALDGESIRLSLTNPVLELEGEAPRSGNRIALDNIRRRLELASAGKASLEVERPPGQYKVTLRFPRNEATQ